MSASNRWKSRALWALAAGIGAREAAANSGTVTVTESAGTVTITGDDSNNCIQLSLPTGQLMYVQGISATSITGSGTINLANTTSLVIRMNGGDDQVSVFGSFSGAQLPTTLINLGAGNDNLQMYSPTFTGAVTVEDSAGHDSSYMSGMIAGGALRVLDADNASLSGCLVSGAIELGAEQSVTTNFVNVSGCLSEGDTTVRSGPSGSNVFLENNQTYGQLRMIGGDGDDSLQTNGGLALTGIRIDGGAGNDDLQVAAMSVPTGTVEVVGGSGDDFINVSTDRQKVATGKDESFDVVVRANSGNDTVLAGTEFGGTTFFGRLSLQCGVGNDTMRVVNVVADSMDLRQNTGRDSLTIADSSTSGKMRADGGDGSDTVYGLTGDSSNNFGKSSVVSYERSFPYNRPE